MKKTIMFLGVLSLGLAHAQQNDPYTGKVGINDAEPKATLDIKAHKKDGTSKEGILIPRLTKDEISKIAEPEHSTLAFITDVEYTTGTDTNADDRVSKVNIPGFYFFSTVENRWVKINDKAVDPATVGKTLVYTDRNPNSPSWGGPTPLFGEVPADDPSFQSNPSLAQKTDYIYVDPNGNSYVWSPSENRYITGPSLESESLFYKEGTTEDAVGKIASMYRVGKIGIGVKRPISHIHTTGHISGRVHNYIYLSVDNTKGDISPTDLTFNTLIEAITYANTIVNSGRVVIQVFNTSNEINRSVVIARDMYISGAHTTSNTLKNIDINGQITLINGVTFGFSEGYNLQVNQNIPVAFRTYGDNTIALGGHSGIIWNFTANDQKLMEMRYAETEHNNEVQLAMSRVKFTPNTFTGLGWAKTSHTNTGVFNIAYWDTTLPTNMSYARVGKVVYSNSPGTETYHNIAGTTLAFSGLDAANNNALVERMKIDKAGYIGIGQPAPKQKLDVAGSIKIASTDDTCNGTKAGTIRFKDNKFQGCTSTGWVDLH